MHRTITKWEIFVPPLDPGDLSKTVTVEAANWMDALTAGLDQIGQEGPTSSNLMLDIKDGAFHVTDLQSRRVFEVQPLSTRPAARDGSSAAPSTPPPPGLSSSHPLQAPSDGAETTTAETKKEEPELKRADTKREKPKKRDSKREEPEPEKAEATGDKPEPTKATKKKSEKREKSELKKADTKREKPEPKRADTKREKPEPKKAEVAQVVPRADEVDSPTQSKESASPATAYKPKNPVEAQAKRATVKPKVREKEKSQRRAAEFIEKVRLTPTKSIGEPKLSKAAPLIDVVVVPEKGDSVADSTEETLPAAAKSGAPTSAPPAEFPEPTEDEKEKPVEKSVVIPAEGDLVAHEIFFFRDDDPGDGGRLTYRERLFAVDEETSSASAETLLRHYYKTIKKEISKRPRGKFINLAVFDHVFSERAQRPAIAALDWKDWKRKPNVSFPLEAPSVVETSYIPGVRQARGEVEDSHRRDAKDKSADHGESSALSRSSDESRLEGDGKDESGRSKPEKSGPKSDQWEKARKKKGGSEAGDALQRTPSQQLRIGRVAKKPDLNEVLVEVFEAMQDLYFIDRKRAAIKFAVDLIADKIPCRAVAGLSNVSNNPDEMVYVTARGNDVEAIIGKRSPLRGTLLGLAVRQGVAVAVSDAQNDSRVKAELEHLIDKDTRSVLCVPFTFEGRNFGAAELVNREGGDTWRQGEIHIISYVANHLSEYIAQSLDSHEDFEADFASAPPSPARPAKTAEKLPAAAQKPKKSAKSTSHSKKSRKKKKRR